ncbi:MAG: hypothetical protein JO111_07560 [Caulobacteraceae bacterium]|nr:hypothetical protein [Caulobacteraceae bacterium]
MDEELEKRLASVVDRLQRSPRGAETELDRNRRRARERLLSELPRLEARLLDVLAELNDALALANMALRLTKASHTPVAEAVYTVGLSGVREPEPVLVLIVEGLGRVRAMLERDHHRSLVETIDIFDLDKNQLSSLALTLLEAHASA